MKKISILVAIALIAMAVEMISGSIDAWGGSSAVSLIKERLKQEESKAGKGHSIAISQVLNVRALSGESITESVTDIESGTQIPYSLHQLVTVVKAPWWILIPRFLILPILPLIIWGIVNFVRMLISVFKHQIFTRKNARRLRIFVYTSYGSMTVFTLVEWLTYRYVAARVELPGFSIEPYDNVMNWSDMLLTLLIVEIFALGVKLQEEQELTI